MILNIFNSKTEETSDIVKNIFLVDYENVNDKGLTGLEHLKRGDALYIFHNDTTSKMTIDMAHTLFNLPEIGITVENIQVVHTGKNAVDMILAATLGMVVSKVTDKNVCIHIISKDKGLCSLIENIPSIASTCNTTTTFTYKKAASIEECFVVKKPVRNTVKKAVKKTAQKTKSNKKTEIKEKKPEVKKEEKKAKKAVKQKTETKNTKSVPEKEKQVEKKPQTKQEKSIELQHSKEYKNDINNLRKKFISELSLEADIANKLANSLTGVILKTTSVETKMKNYYKDLDEVTLNKVKTLEEEIKQLIKKY